ncbi:hypothetical protein ACF0H5_006394 [Mactra antiquata]
MVAMAKTSETGGVGDKASDSEGVISVLFDEIGDIRVVQQAIVTQVNTMKEALISLERINLEYDTLMSLTYDVEGLKDTVFELAKKIETYSKDIDKDKLKNGASSEAVNTETATSKTATSKTPEVSEIERLREEITALKDELKKCKTDLREKEEWTRKHCGESKYSSEDNSEGRKACAGS